MKKLITLFLICAGLANAQQSVTVQNNGAGTGTFNTPGVTTYSFAGSTVVGIPSTAGGTVTFSGSPTANQIAYWTGAGNIAGSGSLPNGTAATTQTGGDNTTKVATDAFVLANGASLAGNNTFTGTNTFNNTVSVGAGHLFEADPGSGAAPGITSTGYPTSGFYFGSGPTLGVSISGTSVGTFTSTGLNTMAVGATSPSTGAFTSLSATGMVSATATSNTSYSQLELTNSSGGTSAVDIFGLNNASHALNEAITGVSYSGSFLTNGPSGEAVYLYTTANVPIAFGINNTYIGQMTTSGLTLYGMSTAGVVQNSSAGLLSSSTALPVNETITTPTSVSSTVVAGYIGMPQNPQTGGAYTFALADNGKSVVHTSDSGGRAFTINSNANLALPIGFTCTFINDSGQIDTIPITTDTLTWIAGSGTGSTGTRTIANGSAVTILKIGTTSWIIVGNGIS